MTDESQKKSASDLNDMLSLKVTLSNILKKGMGKKTRLISICGHWRLRFNNLDGNLLQISARITRLQTLLNQSSHDHSNAVTCKAVKKSVPHFELWTNSFL